MKELTATEGMWLTQSADVATESRVVTRRVLLAGNATAEDWREITDDEARAVIAMRDEGTTLNTDSDD